MNPIDALKADPNVSAAFRAALPSIAPNYSGADHKRVADKMAADLTPLVILGQGDYTRTFPPITASEQAEINRRIEQHRERNPGRVADFYCPHCSGKLDDFEPFPDPFESQADRNSQREANPDLRGTWCCDECGATVEELERRDSGD